MPAPASRTVKAIPTALHDAGGGKNRSAHPDCPGQRNGRAWTWWADKTLPTERRGGRDSAWRKSGGRRCRLARTERLAGNWGKRRHFLGPLFQLQEEVRDLLCEGRGEMRAAQVRARERHELAGPGLGRPVKQSQPVSTERNRVVVVAADDEQRQFRMSFGKDHRIEGRGRRPGAGICLLDLGPVPPRNGPGPRRSAQASRSTTPETAYGPCWALRSAIRPPMLIPKA